MTAAENRIETGKVESCAGPAEHPECYGNPERVCPKDEDGIMQPQPGCISCQSLKPCLQTALQKGGLLAPSAAAPVVSKVKGFFKRWSDQKLAHAEAHDECNSK
jgi:hypothetical protein